MKHGTPPDAAAFGFAAGACVLGEEAAAKDPALLERLGGGAPYGSSIPSTGQAIRAAGGDFGVMVGWSERPVVAGWIHDPRDGRMRQQRRAGCVAKRQAPTGRRCARRSTELSGVLLAGFFGNARTRPSGNWRGAIGCEHEEPALRASNICAWLRRDECCPVTKLMPWIIARAS